MGSYVVNWIFVDSLVGIAKSACRTPVSIFLASSRVYTWAVFILLGGSLIPLSHHIQQSQIPKTNHVDELREH